MKILLIQPPVEDFFETAARLFPLGLLSIAAPLLESGLEVKILDAHSRTRKSIPLPKRFGFIRQFYDPGDKSPFRLFGHYYHFGRTWEDIAEEIR
ncbi:MAG TPA: hypothetical protein VJC03_01710, partial [bacterium]|nr:hypothetical protein [bacterium]